MQPVKPMINIPSRIKNESVLDWRLRPHDYSRCTYLVLRSECRWGVVCLCVHSSERIVVLHAHMHHIRIYPLEAIYSLCHERLISLNGISADYAITGGWSSFWTLTSTCLILMCKPPHDWEHTRRYVRTDYHYVQDHGVACFRVRSVQNMPFYI